MNYGDLLGGLGIFLFGMIVFEETVKGLGKDTLKHILEKNTNTRLKSVITGIVETFIFQSSTIVTLMTLGFVGAGIIGLVNGLGVIIGANLGTTLTPWVISLIGFHLKIDAFALPIIGIGALGILIGGVTRFGYFGRFMVGFGFLLLGLNYMKESVDVLAQTVSLEQYSGLSIWGFVLVGIILTSIIQTSTGATVITLTALSGGLISLDMALGIVIGANMGSAVTTTLVGLLSSTSSQNTKRQAAVSHFIFNIVTTILVTLFYTPIKHLLFLMIGPDPDPTIMLALFHTTFNVILACIWIPLLGPLCSFLRWLFPKKILHLGLAIESVHISIPEEYIAALVRDTKTFATKTLSYNRSVFRIGDRVSSPIQNLQSYIEIKQMEQKILKYLTLGVVGQYTAEQSQALQNLNTAVMQLLMSSKYLKDNLHHIDNLRSESGGALEGSYDLLCNNIREVTDFVTQWMQIEKHEVLFHSCIFEIIVQLRQKMDVFIGSIAAKIRQDEDEDVAEVIKVAHYTILSAECLLRGYDSLVSAQQPSTMNISNNTVDFVQETLY